MAALAVVPSAVFVSAQDDSAEQMGTVIGIDLGTTYSCVGVFKNGRVEIIANDQGNRITPSYVAFMDNGDRLVGDAAKNQATINPENTVFDVKRLIGRNFADATVQKDKALFPFEVVADGKGKPVVKMDDKPNIGKFIAEANTYKENKQLPDEYYEWKGELRCREHYVQVGADRCAKCGETASEGKKLKDFEAGLDQNEDIKALRQDVESWAINFGYPGI